MSLNPDIIQFVTDTTARIHQNYPVATQQQRLILDKNTGQVFWDVDYTRYKVNTTPKISYTVNQDSDALVTGNAVFVHVQDTANALQAGIDSALSDAIEYTNQLTSTCIPNSAIVTSVDPSDSNIPTGGAIYEFVQSAITSAKVSWTLYV